MTYNSDDGIPPEGVMVWAGDAKSRPTTVDDADVYAGPMGMLEAPLSLEERAGAERANIEKLAEQLYFMLEKLDPTPEAPEWGRLSERDREFYRLVVEDLIAEWTNLTT